MFHILAFERYNGTFQKVQMDGEEYAVLLKRIFAL